MCCFLSYKTLIKFVRQQAIKGESPERLREGLLLNGWDSADVDKAIAEVYSLKNKVKKTFIVLVILVVIVLSLSLLLLFRTLYFDDGTLPDEVDKKPVVVEEKTCVGISDVILKEDCYLDEIKKGYSCEDLSSEESFFCNRVLEFYLLDSLVY